MVKIFIDPGHEGRKAGYDPGAVGNGLYECDLTLKIALKMKEKLSKYQGVEVKLSRESEKKLSLKQRTDMANAWGADYLISVHINAGGGTGFESYTYNGSYSGKQETNRKRAIVHAEVMKSLGKDVKNRGEKENNFHMVRECKAEAMLSENLFIDTKADADKLKQDSFLDKIAQGHVNGLVIVYNLEKKTAPSKQKEEPVASGETYKIKKGDTFWGIEEALKIAHGTLQKLNPTVDPNKLQVGQVIKISGSSAEYYTIKKGDTFWELENKFKLTHGTLQKLNPKVDPNKLQLGQKIRIK
ncbi:N-acetylmuramoyl-L-alanine amidase [Caldibacillus lycopersici]|uniref:N-acetylmuramoyl-L-alanine amidase n=1 Tax=Perspicuibacillus lycopersici TaxID=1325689 RepID=A0AAE3LNP9_9BACI|nr:N-acetylmuramoyl-L-alanine amidase [Perspicuibacillus lycopersici]MCU9614067.1 N-acetylmuramoyl-L-alanine amidase [Perspicuibacillus lycopersici]